MRPLRRGVASGLLLAFAIGAWVPAWAETTTYDSLGRVISVITDDGKQTTYIYDSAGNRTTVATFSTGVTQAPVAVDDNVSYSYGGTAPTFDPRANDTDPNHLALTIKGISPPQFGTATFTGTSVTYTPSTFHVVGVDAFAYTITNSAGLAASAVIKITLTNLAPVIVPNPVNVTQGSFIAYDPSAKDIDPGGLGFSITAVTQPAHGATVLNGAKQVTYTPSAIPSPGYYGPDTFNYTITDTAGGSATGGAGVTVNALPPVANPYTLTTPVSTQITFDPRVNDTDPNYLSLSITAVGTPSHGAARNNSGVSITYTPTGGYIGADSFGYTVTNTGGGIASSTVNVTVQPAGPLSASASSSSWTWTKYGVNPPHTSPATVAANASGGAPPYTYAWQYVSGDTVMSAGTPTNMSTAWLRTMPVYATYTSLWRCKVTDNVGAVAYTANVTITFYWENSN